MRWILELAVFLILLIKILWLDQFPIVNLCLSFFFVCFLKTKQLLMIEMGINCFFSGILDLDFIHLLLIPLYNLIKIAKHQKIFKLFSQFFSSLWLLFYHDYLIGVCSFKNWVTNKQCHNHDAKKEVNVSQNIF